MAITRDQLKVGETYRSDNWLVNRKILYIGEVCVFYKYSHDDGDIGESSQYIDGFLNDHSIIPKPKKRYWLWDTKTDSGAIYKGAHYMDEDGKLTNGCIGILSIVLVKKHENEFIEVEVSE